MHGMKIRKKDS